LFQLLSISTDLDLAGNDAVEQLTATKTHVRAGEVELALDSIKSFRVHSAVGSGFIQAEIDGAWINLIRYSNALAPRFTKVAKKLEALKKTGELQLDPKDLTDGLCPTCGAKLSGDVCVLCMDRRTIVRRIWDLVDHQRWSTLFLFGLVLLGIAVSLVPPKLQEYLVDDVLSAGDRSAGDGLVSSLGAIVLALALARVFGSGIGQIKGIVSHRIGVELTYRLRERLVEKLNKLPLAFYDKNQVGMLATRVTADSEVLYGFLYQLNHGFLLQLLQFAGVGVMLFVLNAKLAVYTLLPAPLVLGGSMLYWRYIQPKFFRASDASSKQLTSLLGMLSGVRVVKAFAQERRELDRFAQISGHFRDVRLDVGNSGTTYGMTMSLVFSLGGLIVWYAGGRDVIASRMSLGELIAFLAYLAMFYAPLSTLAQLTTWLSSFIASSARVLELLDTPEEMIDPKEPKPIGGTAIEFADVTFGYDRHQPVLERVSLQIPEGQIVGIVGRSGSGKTTLVHLICRFYDVQEGRVSLGGVDVKELSLYELRRRIGVVLQETFLFRGTIWENLTYGRTDATREQAIAAAKAAQAHGFIMKMPFGYDSTVGERGINLSGGERQRLAIARALLYDPPILILDEATSNLDTESERTIQDALEEIARGRTVLAIAHRLSTLRHASRIVVFEKGKLLEDGSHAELLSKNGTYANLVRMQMRAAETTPIEELKEPIEKEKDRSAYTPRWLTPKETRLFRGKHGELRVEIGDEKHGGVSAALAFPTLAGRYICVSAEAELGIIASDSDWDPGSRALLNEALARRYHLRAIEAIHRIELSVGLLTFDVRTPRGARRFVMKSNQTRVQDYDKNGKVLTDLDDNHWMIADLERLPRAQQALFRRYVYW
jgi:ATP-binding cassette, subfamily B, bacterial